MIDRDTILTAVKAQIEPFNKKHVSIAETTTFQGDLEWDSLTVMDFVAAIEDEFDIIITMNIPTAPPPRQRRRPSAICSTNSPR